MTYLLWIADPGLAVNDSIFCFKVSKEPMIPGTTTRRWESKADKLFWDKGILETLFNGFLFFLRINQLEMVSISTGCLGSICPGMALYWNFPLDIFNHNAGNSKISYLIQSYIILRYLHCSVSPWSSTYSFPPDTPRMCSHWRKIMHCLTWPWPHTPCVLPL